MGISLSLLLIAVGAILAWAVDALIDAALVTVDESGHLHQTV